MTLALWTLPLLYFLAYLPRIWAIRATRAQEGTVDIAHPRLQQARLTGLGHRAQAAHQNALEGFAPFGVAVVVAHLYGAPEALRDGLALAYLGARLVYLACYLADLNPWRTLAWVVGFLATLGLFLSPVF